MKFNMIKRTIALLVTVIVSTIAVAEEKPFVSLRVFDGGKQGLMDSVGNVFVDIRYDYIDDDFNDGLARFRIDRKFGYLDTNGREVISPVYDGAADFHRESALIIKDGRYGFIDMNGRMAIIPQYEDARPFKQGFAWVKNRQGWGVIDKTGKTVLPHSYPSCYFSSDGYVEIRAPENKGKGIATYAGQILVPPEYDRIESFAGGFYATKGGAESTDTLHVYDTAGTLKREVTGNRFSFYGPVFSYTTAETRVRVITRADSEKNLEVDYTDIRKIGVLREKTEETLYRFRENGSYGVISEYLNVYIPAEYSRIVRMDERFIQVERDETRETVEIRGNSIRTYPYDSVSEFSPDVYRVTKNQKIGFIRAADGSIITSPTLDRVWELSEGLAVFAVNYSKNKLYSDYRGTKFDMYANRGLDDGDFGYVDRNGEIAMPAIFDCAYEFSEGLAVVRFGGFHTGKRGYININGEMVINPSYSYAYSFGNGIACVIVDEKPGYIDKTGEFIFGPSL